MRARGRPLRTSLCSAVLVVSGIVFGGSASGEGRPADFTFLFWTDQEINHNQKDANYARLAPTIDAMNAIAGKEYPAAIGGKVAEPDFIASGGDTTGWPTNYCVNEVWEDIVRKKLKYPTRAVAGNHDSGGNSPSQTFYNWLRKDPFAAERASDNGQPAWKPPDAGGGIIPGINYSFRHKGVVFIMWTPAYWGNGAPAGSSYLNQYDLAWLTAELAKYGAGEPKVVVNHLNYGSLKNRGELDALFEPNNVLLMLSGHWEKVQHWAGTSSVTDYVMDEGCRGKPYNASFSVVRFGRDRLTLAHYMSGAERADQTGTGSWHERTIVRAIPERWAEDDPRGE